MAPVTYYGHVTMTYLDYIDTATGKTLVCVPGQTYNVTPASGNVRSSGSTMPNDGRFTVTGGREIAFDDDGALPEEETPAGTEEDSSTSTGETV